MVSKKEIQKKLDLNQRLIQEVMTYASEDKDYTMWLNGYSRALKDLLEVK